MRPDPEPGTIRTGYVDLQFTRLAEHSYCNGNSDIFRFGCYGRIEGGTYPASFWEPRWWRPADLGATMAVDMQFARFIAANGNPGWNRKRQFTETSGGWMHLGDCAGLIYAINGVCHQMANAILLSSGSELRSPVVWPPSFNATLPIFGWRGRFFGSTAPLPRRLGWLLASYDGMNPAPFRDDDLATYLNEGVTPAGRLRELQGHFPQLADQLFDNGGYREPDLWFIQEKHRLDRALLQGEVTPAAFAGSVNAAFRERTAAQSDALTGTGFEALAPAGEIPDLVAPELMASAEAYRFVGEGLLR